LLSPGEYRDSVTVALPVDDSRDSVTVALERSEGHHESGFQVRPSPRGMIPAASTPKPIAAPQLFGSYRLSDPIGVGGMSTVHLGVRAEDPFRVYAIKRLHPQFVTDDYLAHMLLDEAAIAARIRHENVVAMYGASMVDGDLVLVMEYRAGVTLADLIASVYPKKVPPRIAVAIMAGVLRGLHAAHEAVDDEGRSLEIVHRDVSPQNIHVGVDGVARVLDFGIAKTTSRMQTTRAGEIKGRIAYMAPEQLLSRGIDHRVDIRAAAAVLWETLTGQPLFHGENEGETVTRVLGGCTTRPSEIVPDLPPTLDAIIMKALAARREDRFATALEMAQALEAVYPSTPHPNEIGAWIAAFAAGALREQWNVRSRLLEGTGSGSFSFEQITALVPQAATPAPVRPSTSERPQSAIPTARRQGSIAPKSSSGRTLQTIWLSLLVAMLVVLAVMADRAIGRRSVDDPAPAAPAKTQTVRH
jgi:serine/threonine-protein kinase